MSLLKLERSHDGSFGPEQMREWLEKYARADWVRNREPGLQRQFDELAAACLDQNEVALGIGVAWLSVMRALGRHGDVVAYMFAILVHKNSNGEPEQSCRICGCTTFNCRGCVERTGEPCHWVEPDLCSACVGLEGGRN